MIKRGAALVVLGIVAAQWLSVATAGDFGSESPERVEYGDLCVSVTAPGVVVANELVDLKSKASGRVREICVQEGQMVKAGAVLLRLDPVDEARAVERTQAEVDRMNAIFEQAIIRLEDAKQNRPLDIESAQDVVDQMKARRDELQIDVDKLREMCVEAKSPVEEKKAAAALKCAIAALAKAEVDLRRTKNFQPIAIATAEHDVVASEAQLRSAQKQLDDSRERLKETTVTAPADGMVYSIGVRKGEVIQSGTSGYTGGTVLLSLADVAKMYVVAHVPQAAIGAVRNAAPDFAQPGRARAVSDEELIASAPLPPADSKSLPTAVATTPPTNSRRRVGVHVEAYPEEAFEGIIERILPAPRTGLNANSFDVRIRLVGNDLARLLSLQVNVCFAMEFRKNVLKVRNEALVCNGSDVYVRVRNPEEPARPRRVKVRVGKSDGVCTEIVSGLASGSRVWVEADGAVVDSTQVRSTPPPVVAGPRPAETASAPPAAVLPEAAACEPEKARVPMDTAVEAP